MKNLTKNYLETKLWGKVLSLELIENLEKQVEDALNENELTEFEAQQSLKYLSSVKNDLLKNPSKEFIKGRRLVQFGDLNAAGNLFGGTLLAWVDEQAALFAMCQLGTKNIVTVSMDASVFKVPVAVGDFLEFGFTAKKFGRTSLTVGVVVYRRDFAEAGHEVPEGEDFKHTKVFQTDIVFVKVNPITRKSEPHGKEYPRV